MSDRVGAGRDGAGAARRDERLRRWRLVLGGEDGRDGRRLCGATTSGSTACSPRCTRAHPAAARAGGRHGGLGRSSPQVARWLGDIRRYFPTTVVQVMQRDAIERLDLTRLLLEPEMLLALRARHPPGRTVLADRPGVPARRGPGDGRRIVRHGRRGDRGPAGPAAAPGRERRAAAAPALPPAPAGRHRLEPDHPGQPPPLAAGAADPRARARHRLRSAGAGHPAGARHRHRPVGLHGRVRGARGRHGLGAGLGAIAAHLRGGLQHRGRRPHLGPRTIRSTCCSASSSAAGPTSTAPSRTARG